MTKEERVPVFRGEELYIPFVGAIIYRESGNELEILVQTRENPFDKVYGGSIEIPGGKFRAFEDIYETVKREVKEECGMDVTFIEGENEREDFENRGHQSSLINPYCVTQAKEGPFIGLIFLCKAEGKPAKKTDETKDAKWMPISEVKDLVDNNPERVFTAFLAPLKKFIRGRS